MKFFEEFYLGVCSHKRIYMTHFTQDAAFENRKKTVVRDLNGGRYSVSVGVDGKVYDRYGVEKTDVIFGEVVKNELISGYVVSDLIYVSDYTKYLLWHPKHSAKIEISAENMFHLIETCKINCGVIEDELVWLKDGSTNWVVPLHSKHYIQRK